MPTDVEKAFDALNLKRPILASYYKYVNGPQPLKYSTQRLYEAFDSITVHFDINWCSVIVDASNDRLELNGFDIQDKAAHDWLLDLFEEVQLHQESRKVHKAALGYSQGYLIVWKDSKGGVEVYYNDPRLCEIFYDPAHPKEKLWAAKWYAIDTQTQEMILYYPDRIEHWISKGAGAPLNSAASFHIVSSEFNPYGIIPVFEFYTDGEIAQVTSIQDAINKLFSDMMVAGEFGAFVQRWVISQADPGELKNGPNEIWWIPGGDVGGQGSSVGQFTPTVLTSYLDAMDRLATALFIITRTPKHYFIAIGSNISGEALLAMEAPFVKKAESYKKLFDSYWKEVIQFVLLLGGFTVPKKQISPVWKKVESSQPLTEAQADQIMINIGIPLRTVLQRRGWSEAEIAAMEEDMAKDKQAKLSIGQAVLDNLRNQDASTNPPGSPIPSAPPVGGLGA